MGSRHLHHHRKDWIEKNPDRFFSAKTPCAVTDATQLVLAARTALAMGEKEIALRLYVRATELLKGAEREEPGKFKDALNGARTELKRLIARH